MILGVIAVLTAGGVLVFQGGRVAASSHSTSPEASGSPVSREPFKPLISAVRDRMENHLISIGLCVGLVTMVFSPRQTPLGLVEIALGTVIAGAIWGAILIGIRRLWRRVGGPRHVGRSG